MSQRPTPESKVERLQRQGALNPRPQTVSNKLFQEEDFFDAQDLVQVRYEMLRLVAYDGRSVTESAAAFGFSRPAFYRIQAAYKAGGLPGLLPRKRGPRGPHKLTPELIIFLERCRNEDPALDSAALASLVHQRYQIRLHHRTIERALSGKKTAHP